ncbi:MAG: TetR/AcrR family transcriptional regulator [Myxococcota bacterium]
MSTRRPTEERRVQIAEAALRIISGKGVHRLTAQELGREVGIADGTVFRHFKDKAEIVRAAIGHLEAILFRGFPPADEDPLARLKTFFVGRLELMRSMPSLFFAAFSDRLEEAAGEDAPLVRSIIERSQAFVRQCLVEAQEQGSVSRALPPEALTLVVLGTLQASAFTHHRLGKKSQMDPESIWQVVEIMLRKSAA